MIYSNVDILDGNLDVSDNIFIPALEYSGCP